MYINSNSALFRFIFSDRLQAGKINEVKWLGLIPVEPIGCFTYRTHRTFCLLLPLPSTNQRTSRTVWDSHMLEGAPWPMWLRGSFQTCHCTKDDVVSQHPGLGCLALSCSLAFLFLSCRQQDLFAELLSGRTQLDDSFEDLRSNVGTDESRGQVTSLGLDVTWSCRSHRILGLRVQRTSCAVWESGFWGSIVRLCHCICTYYYIYFLSHFFHSFHSLVPFQPYLAALGPVEYLGLFCTASNCDDCCPPRFSFPLLSSLTCKDQGELDKLRKTYNFIIYTSIYI